MQNEAIQITLLCLGAFFFGAVPFGFLAGKWKGVDLRLHGSGNIGATNTLRVLGPLMGSTVLVLDALKGAAPVLLALHALPLSPPVRPWVAVGAGLCAVLGHNYSPFLGFKGGKGVATSLGVLIGLNWIVALLSVVVFVLVVWVSDFVSLGSLVAAATQAALFWLLPGQPLAMRLFSLLVAAFVIVRHRANIGRLRRGEESRFRRKKTEGTAGTTDKEAGDGGSVP